MGIPRSPAVRAPRFHCRGYRGVQRTAAVWLPKAWALRRKLPPLFSTAQHRAKGFNPHSHHETGTIIISDSQTRILRPKAHTCRRQSWDSNLGPWLPEPGSHFSDKKSSRLLTRCQPSCQALDTLSLALRTTHDKTGHRKLGSFQGAEATFTPRPGTGELALTTALPRR